ncbi:signal peptidase I [Enterococcus sp. AZ192]|uniref:signal peptidase I n=1 Tax=unclassified Enterococcus TaxID=2608891 RepID=UPI003D2BFACF
MEQKAKVKNHKRRKKIREQTAKKKNVKSRKSQQTTAKTTVTSAAKKKHSSSRTIDRKKGKRKKTSQKRKRSEQRHQIYKEIGISFFLLMSLFFLLQWLFFSLPTVNGYGMTATLNDGDRLFVRKHAQIKRFDLIYFKNPVNDQLMIRRVIGLPGEEITYEEDQLMIDQKFVVERFLVNEQNEAKAEERLLTENFSLASLTGSRALPKGSYFVLGDNRHYAADSRQFGWIDEENIIGVVKTRLLPLHNMTQF